MRIRRVFEWIQKILSIVIDWVTETYNWLSDAFTNWDMELEDFKEQLAFMARKTFEFIGIIMDKIRYCIGEIQKLIAEILKGFRGWG